MSFFRDCDKCDGNTQFEHCSPCDANQTLDITSLDLMSANAWKEQEEEEIVVKMALDGPIDDYVNATVGGYAQNGYVRANEEMLWMCVFLQAIVASILYSLQPCGSPSDHGPPMIGDILEMMCEMIAKEDRKTVFMLIKPTESEGNTSRVFVHGVHLMEEQTIADFINDLEQENLSMLPKLCEIRKTTTLFWHKDRLRSMQSCQDPVMEILGERILSEMVDLENLMLLPIEGRTWMIAGIGF
ncbi:hypothetical protein SUGI_0554010 [Cryptomeria japonica]|nr:hypothetical protein SUGI_0554010 [Cryptomeria japonica]